MGKRLILSAIAALLIATPASSPAAETPPGEAPAGASILSLQRVVELAKEQAPSVALARAGVTIGRSAYAGARLSPLTNPTLEVFIDRGLGKGATKDVMVQSNLWVPIEVSGQRGLRIAEADALVALQEANLVAARAEAAGAAVRAYGAVLVATARVQTLSTIVDASRAEAGVYAARLEAGDATEQEATLARVELGRNVVALTEGRADVVHALMELNQLTGLSLQHAPDGPLDPLAAGPPPAAGAGPGAAETAARSPTVLAAESEARFYARAGDRWAREAHTPLSLILSAGRGDLGELRVGGGVAFTFPVARRNQGEQARAGAEQERALTERDVRARVITATLAGLTAERREVRRAIAELTTAAQPAAVDAVDAAVATQRAGKGELLAVLVARRDLALLKARRLDLILRDWTLLGEIVRLTGELP